MNQNIAIEADLTPIKEFLSDKGYSVDTIESSATSAHPDKKYDAYVVTGMNTNFMGIHDTETKAVVIQAAGLTPEQVYKELQSRLH